MKPYYIKQDLFIDKPEPTNLERLKTFLIAFTTFIAGAYVFTEMFVQLT